MRPLRIDMDGFGAFRAPTTIDFVDADVLALVGPTGSGKSTVIDAMTFALYGSVARYEDRRTVHPVINQMSAQARVSLTFEVADQQYVATRVVRRTKSGATTPEARLESGGEVVAGTASEITEFVTNLLGLDFDRFNRTVVLPQGRFAAFLNDKQKDRQELLRHLLDLGVYGRIGSVARERSKAATIRREALEERLNAEGAPNAEELAELVSLQEQVDETTGEVAALRSELADLGEQRTSVVSSIESLTEAARVLEAVRVPPELGELNERLAVAEQQERDLRSEAAELTADLERLDAEIAAGPNLERCVRQRADWQAVDRFDVAMGELSTSLADIEERLEVARADHREFDEEISEAKRAADAAALAVDAAKTELESHPRVEEIERISSLWATSASVADKLAQVSHDLASADTELEKSRAELVGIEADMSTARIDLEHQRALVGAASFRDHLEQGEPCPLCLAPVEQIPSFGDHDDPASDNDPVHAAERRVEQLRSSASSLQQSIAAATEEVGSYRGALSQLRSNQTEVEAQLAGAPSVEELASLLTTAHELVDAARSAAETHARLLSESEALETSPQRQAAASLVEQLAAEADRLTTERGKVEAAADERRRDLVGAPSVTELTELIVSVEAQHAQRDALRISVRSQHEQCDAHRQLIASLHQKIDGLREEFRGYRDSLVSVRQTVSATMDAPGTAQVQPSVKVEPLSLPSLPTPTPSLHDDYVALLEWARTGVTAIEAQQVALAEVAQTIDRSSAQATEKLTSVVAPLLSALEESNHVSASQREDLVAAVAARSTDQLHVLLSKQQGALGQRHAHMETALLEFEALADQVKGIRAEEQVASELGTLLKADRFERWVMGEIVEDLAERATVRLYQLSGQRFSLVAENAEFKVVDHSNADEQRDTRTLSGGETFLASLALALALADSIAELAPAGVPPLGSLFLDEGFGTLDAATLDVVAAAIEELGASGRMVGIITHINELADRMPVRFEVESHAGGSRIERVEA